MPEQRDEPAFGRELRLQREAAEFVGDVNFDHAAPCVRLRLALRARNSE